jgi:hypothetical protein
MLRAGFFPANASIDANQIREQGGRLRKKWQ